MMVGFPIFWCVFKCLDAFAMSFPSLGGFTSTFWGNHEWDWSPDFLLGTYIVFVYSKPTDICVLILYPDTVVRHPLEMTTWVQANRKSSLAAWWLGVWFPSAVLSLSQGECLSIKIISWVDTLQLARTISRKRNYRSPKSRLVNLRTFPELCGLWWIRSLLSLWQVMLPMCWVSWPEWYFHHRVSCAKTWGPVTLLCQKCLSTHLCILS